MSRAQRKTRVVIIGAGVMGLSCAVEMAADSKLDVTVIDRAHPGAGSTSRSVGVYTRQYLTRRDIELRVRSVEELFKLEADAGLHLRRIGYIRIGREPGIRTTFEQSIELQRELGVEGARIIDGDELRRLVPHLHGAGVECCLYCPTDGYLDGAELCGILTQKAEAAGARLLVRTRLRDSVAAGRTGTSSRRTPVCSPPTWWSTARGLGRERSATSSRRPWLSVNERHEAHNFELPSNASYTMPMVMDYVPGGSPEPGLYFRHEGKSQLVAGLHSTDIVGGDQVDPNDYFEGATHAGADAVIKKLATAFPELDGIGYRGGWAGLYPHSPDERPIAGPHHENPDVLVGAGLGGVGLSLGPAIGKLLAEWVRLGEPRSIEGAADMVLRPVA